MKEEFDAGEITYFRDLLGNLYRRFDDDYYIYDLRMLGLTEGEIANVLTCGFNPIPLIVFMTRGGHLKKSPLSNQELAPIGNQELALIGK